MEYPDVTVGIVWSRDDEFINSAISSVAAQVYPGKVSLIVIDNRKRDKSIGACYNKIVEQCNTDWILYLGDDDYITRDYVTSCMVDFVAARDKYPDIWCIVTNCTLISADNTKRQPVEWVPQGMWRKDFLIEHPWDEELERHVDIAHFDLVDAMSGAEAKHKLLVRHQFGYNYRQHGGNVSGDKWEKARLGLIERDKYMREHFLGFELTEGEIANMAVNLEQSDANVHTS